MKVIQLQNVTKTFHRSGGQKLLRHYLEDLLGKTDPERFFALKDVSFSVRDGESVAVIGANGAGKSTLLSLVTGLAPPSAGTVTVTGRAAALLDLGSGFHPDLLGFSRSRAYALYDQIVEFSELDDFIKEPLRTYSNGMMLRLAFSVAVNLDPQILIIDEVLAVGDQKFQAKCTEKIFEIRNQGRTILCVSHVSPTLRELCDRAIWLDHGQLIMDGPIGEVSAAYEGRLTSPA